MIFRIHSCPYCRWHFVVISFKKTNFDHENNSRSLLLLSLQCITKQILEFVYGYWAKRYREKKLRKFYSCLLSSSSTNYSLFCRYGPSNKFSLIINLNDFRVSHANYLRSYISFTSKYDIFCCVALFGYLKSFFTLLLGQSAEIYLHPRVPHYVVSLKKRVAEVKIAAMHVQCK